jgi:CPA2 family monovalent cation:H+ antiporter-2
MAPWLIGLGLSQIGEFSFVLARSGVSSGLLSKSTYDLALTTTVLTMALSPLVSRLALPLGRAWRRWRRTDAAPQTIEFPENVPQEHVIVAGYGQSGRTAARVLQRACIPMVVVELDHVVYSDLVARGLPGVWGDATSEEVLSAARIDKARVLLLTVPYASSAHLAVQRAKALNPKLMIIARALMAPQVVELRDLGVDAVVQSDFEGGVAMVRQALAQYEKDDTAVFRSVMEARREFYGEA